jgi:hypothetical protein
MHKSIRIAVTALVALCLSACAAVVPALNLLDTAVSVTKPAAAVGDKVVLEGTRGLILAHNAVQGSLAVLTPLIRARKLTNDQVNMVEVLINQAERLFAGTGAALSVAERTASLLLVANQLSQIGATTR